MVGVTLSRQTRLRRLLGREDISRMTDTVFQEIYFFSIDPCHMNIIYI